MARLWGEKRLFYTLEEFSSLLNLPTPSARVWASRKKKAGELLSLRRNLYLLPGRWQQVSEEELFRLANIIQTPSAISFLSALSYHNLSTQIGPSFVDSINPVRSRSYDVNDVTFRYFFCKKDFFFGYQREKGFFMAEPEKGLLDTLYFVFLGRYAVDKNALDLRKIRWGQIEKWLKRYPSRFQKYCKKWRSVYERPRTS
ncbi:MAG: hypothetical protein HYS22_08455 [Deltaproteobacteria bacterium]|nr:hypothetical protein [Deltaproteobacteria bacterium]